MTFEGTFDVVGKLFDCDSGIFLAAVVAGLLLPFRDNPVGKIVLAHTVSTYSLLFNHLRVPLEYKPKPLANFITLLFLCLVKFCSF